MDQNQCLNKTTGTQSSKKKKPRCCDGFKMFLAALTFANISKSIGGVIMKSSIIHIERRFEISSALSGVIDGGFEIGCEKDSGSYMWIYVLMGNMLRGIGETPIMPLGMAYIDDFAKDGHSSFYAGILGAVSMIGIIFAFVLGSLSARLYVDVGYVDLSSITITPKDSRWVGAWWLGLLVSGLLCIISSVPFFFLPKSLNTSQEKRKVSISLHVLKTNGESNQTENLTNDGQNVTKSDTGFFQSLKTILINPLYIMVMLLTLIQFSGFIGFFSYAIKYIEQQHGFSASEANFALGLINIPSVAVGMFTGGYIIKKFRLTMVEIAKFMLFTSFISLLFQPIYFFLICETKPVAGLTLNYDGNNTVGSHVGVPLSYCNSDCNCDENQWEPVCGNNGITYMSPCLAGCKSSSGNKKPIVFYNCSCVEVTGFQNRNDSVHLGECPREDHCKSKYYILLVVQAVNYFCSSLVHTAYFLLIVRTVQPELKSLALGFQTLVIRSIGGLLTPIYFGAMIDTTCIKWSINNCGKRGSCRMYDSLLLGKTVWGLSSAFRFPPIFLLIATIFLMRRKYEGNDTKALENGRKVMDEANLET
ncbi:Solute carrier organic anion transporter family member 1B3 [Tupaia chinensis]|uniref:Solute carrier organic anion transporter family member n=1 Tax=Tupaia chinensis TaxID=246437 RepID=L9KCK1_TUPCH|nr:Solute carrier organic anion transporter family member 1B3 [Tupaia chinensis]